ncbi:hypothetical protein COU15_00250 [Candidatus Kaiserbacteria bacterium CG10_big_fil_rev_8_21_14_0_10_45_20]|uniref:histidine kinase n=1 Tax=Candidatus Kaiserbacteria bacterium CG10_big_fil_rev_8_21_14_0_10_45_20 TaxID=1974607 RepID=A0A2H0UGH7_9BACT|nr:MAG: hypothetical protein COU15_00250 [Candidatus Kaiserbacteria bacterium CG10_big_fil_rev_8_21_14_0_10_45_20]
MVFDADIINILIATVAVLNTLYGLIVFSRNRKNTTNQSFFFLSLAVSSWGIAMLFLRGAHDPDLAVWGARALYATAALIPFASVYFARLFPEEKRFLSFFEKNIVPLPFITILIITLLPYGGLIEDVTLTQGAEPSISFNFLLHSVYILFIVGYFSWVYVILFSKLLKTKGILRIQLTYILIGTLATTATGVVTNLLLPYFNIFTFNWVGQIGVLAMITFILYSILKHHLFSVSVIATEIFVVVLELTLFTQIFIAQTLQERLLATGIFFGSFVIGILLIRSVIREVEARTEVEKLAKKLQDANVKLKELDKLKSQFLSIASHDLRAPLSSIRNFMSLLLEDTYGKLPPAAEEGVRQVFGRATEMAQMVDDYLNVSRIEQGSMKYDFAPADLVKLVSESVEGMKANAEQKHLDLSFYVPSGIQKIPIKADVGRLREVFNNLIDNSIKYTPKGSIKVFIEGGESTARVVIQDTGVGITEETKKNLFKLFSPGQFSRKINPSSTGVGLYVVKKHVEAHGGNVWVESAGEGKGSRFYVEFPITLTPGEATVHKFANDL